MLRYGSSQWISNLAYKRNRTARKVDGIPTPICYDLDNVWIGDFQRIVDPLLEGSHYDVIVVYHSQDCRINRVRIDQRFVSLDVHHDIRALGRNYFRDAIGSRRMVRPRHPDTRPK